MGELQHFIPSNFNWYLQLPGEEQINYSVLELTQTCNLFIIIANKLSLTCNKKSKKTPQTFSDFWPHLQIVQHQYYYCSHSLVRYLECTVLSYRVKRFCVLEGHF